ncbi:MAG: DUF3828 domain-containing protein [Alphaproteobacteria bacterium]
MSAARRTVLLGAIFLLACLAGAPAFSAAEASPEAFLKSIYDRYIGDAKKALGVPLDSERKIRRYFTPELAALIIKDQREAAKRKEPPTLEGDPFVDAQEWQIAAVDIAVNHATADKALATVNFRNFDKPVTLRLELVQLKDGWKISDIRWSEGSLRDLLSGK